MIVVHCDKCHTLYLNVPGGEALVCDCREAHKTKYAKCVKVYGFASEDGLPDGWRHLDTEAKRVKVGVLP